jgi:phosphate-selective porin
MKLMRKLSLLAAALLLAPGLSQATTLEELLVQKGIITKGEAAGAGGGSSKVYYNGGTRMEFPESGFTMKLNTTIQERYTFTDNDDGVENTSSFSTPKVRLAISGTALNEEFSYYMKADFVGADDDENGNVANLQDSYITWHACDWAWARMGQFKTGISRQNVGHDEALQFADRSNASDFFNLGRQQGLQVGGEWDSLTAAAGIFNGQSIGEGQNRPGVDTNHTAVLNVRYNMGEIDPKVEGDIDNTQDHAWTLGAAVAFAEDEVGAADTQDTTTVNADIMYKYMGFSVAGEYYHRNVDVADDDTSDDGFYVQAGYFLTPEEFEIAARYSLVTYDDDNVEGRDDTDEIAASLNYYWWKHSLKAQFGWSHLTETPQEGDSVESNRWLFQVSSWF